MTTLTNTFARLKQEKRVALIPFLTAGYPNQKTFEQLLLNVIKAGADIVEIGIPFSDPLADGPTIQFSSHAALQNGTTLAGTLERLAILSGRLSSPLVIMSYYNPIKAYGVSKFLRDTKKTGVKGLIVPDMIVEESSSLEQSTAAHRIDLIQLLTPTSGNDRTIKIITHARGFLYLVSVAGVTGSRHKLPSSLGQWVNSVRAYTNLPLCVGFGISTPRLAAEISRYADGVIIGSAMIDLIRGASTNKQAITHVTRFISNVRKTIDGRH